MVFVVQEANTSNLLAFNIYITGNPQVVVIDDQVPFVENAGKVIPAFT